MAVWDISLLVSESLPVWPGDPAIRIRQVTSLAHGDAATVSHLDLGAHTGTHVDAPGHFVPGGGGVDALALEALIGPVWVACVPDVEAISAEVLAGLNIPPGTHRLLLRTRNSTLWARGVIEFALDFVALTEDGARWLVASGVRLVGVDYLSVGPFDDPAPVHRVLLSAGVLIVEGLDLSRIETGAYCLVCLPLKLLAADGAPARAILIRAEDGGSHEGQSGGAGLSRC